ncbi:glycosyltransferase family 25 protein, partial [Helicobacter pylori]|uniref:glycosyltransferase family 25 protein n=1 Tax=Helicobacter pylori TaxID=210 RepID=UPI003465F8CF
MTQVYIISLKESQRRLDTEKLVLKSNEKFKGRCVFQIFDAISPKHEDFEKFVQELYDSSSLLKSDWFHSDYCYQELLPQEFGCYLSHYLLWKECVKTNQPVVILEDDVALESNFMQALEDCLKSPFDFVRLYGHYWGGHKTNLCALPIYTENENEEAEAPIENHAEAEASMEKTPIENYEVTTPPPPPTKNPKKDEKCKKTTPITNTHNPTKDTTPHRELTPRTKTTRDNKKEKKKSARSQNVIHKLYQI